MHKPWGAINCLSAVILLILSSCYSPRYVYSPPTQNIPWVNKKGDFNVGAYFATGGGSSSLGSASSQDYNTGMDLQDSYAFTDHFAIMLNKYNRWEKNNGGNDFNAGDSSIIKYKRALTEIGAGYFTPLRKDSKKSFFQFFAGIGFGKFTLKDNSVNNGIHFNRFHTANITKIFVQPAIIIGQQQNFSASFSSRISEVFYNNIHTDYNQPELDKYLLNDLSSSPIFFWEPAMNYSFGFKKVKGVRLDFQSGFAILINRRFVDYRTINIGLGVIATNGLFKNTSRLKQSAIKGANQ